MDNKDGEIKCYETDRLLEKSMREIRKDIKDENELESLE